MIEMPTTVSQEDLEVLVDLVRKHLETTGETQGSLAERAGVTRGMIARLVHSRYESSPSLDNVSRIAAAIGYRLRWTPM